VVWFCIGELGRPRSPAAGVVDEAETEASPHLGPESESGDGIDRGGAPTMVASVLVDEALDTDAATDSGVG